MKNTLQRYGFFAMCQEKSKKKRAQEAFFNVSVALLENCLVDNEQTGGWKTVIPHRAPSPSGIPLRGDRC